MNIQRSWATPITAGAFLLLIGFAPLGDVFGAKE
jgi:hypothetical protein